MATIDIETALEILSEAKNGGYEDQPLPEDPDEVVARATYFYDEAKKAFEDGMRDNTIQTIIFLGDSPLPEESDNPVAATYPRRSSGGLSEGDERDGEGGDVKIEKGTTRGTSAPHTPVVETDEVELMSPGVFFAGKIASENLPVPQHIEGDPDPMPRDLSELTDKEVRRLSGEYNAYLARVTYLLGINSSDLANAEHLLDAQRAKVLRGLDLVDPNGDGKKQKLMKVIESEILADEKVTKLMQEVSANQQNVIILKSLKEIYGGNVDRLSREWTMRQNEWEKSR
jgi:hypothetical protein